MADRFVQTHIRRLPVFQHLDNRQLGLITRAFEVMRFEPGEVVFRQGQPALGLYMLVSGQGELVQVGPDGRERTLGVVRENQYLNEATLFKETTETASLRITQTAIILVLRRQRLLTTLAHQPELKAVLGMSPTRQPREVKPTSFKGLRDDERLLAMTRRHWWAFGRRVWLMVLLAVLILIGATMMPVPLLGWALAGFAIIGPGILLLYFYFEWRNDLIIVTNQRVIRIERTIIIFSTHISELPIENVHEAGAETPGTDPFARLFNYGTLTIKTAGHAGSMVLDFVPDAQHMQDTILNRRSHQQEHVSEQRRQFIRAEIDRLLGTDHAPVGGRFPAPAGHEQGAPQTQSTSGPGWIRTKFINAQGATVYRKHTTIWARHIFLPSLVILAGVGIFILSLIHPSFQHVGVIGPILAFFVMLLGGIWFYWADWDWRNDTYVISDETITLIRKRPLWLQNENDQFLLSKVDNVVSDIRGPLRNLLNYGTVRVSLFGADTTEMKLLEDIPDPRAVQAEISRRRERARMRAEESEAKRQREAISEYLSVYHETVNPPAQSGAEPPPPSSTYSSSVAPSQDRSRPPGIPRVRRD